MAEKDNSNRVLRGGSWYYTAVLCRSGNRKWRTPSNRYFNVGFRVVAKERTDGREER